MSASLRPLADALPAALGRIPFFGRRPVAEPAGMAGVDAGRRLVAKGHAGSAQHLLRDLPRQARTRAERVALTIEAARVDPEFQREVAAADVARDAGDWPRAEYLYWRALRLHPQHAGYLVQYGHVLKEQGKLPDAEVAYRSARSLGAPPRDVDEHILHVQAVLGHVGTLPSLPAATAHPLDLPPTRDDVEALFGLLLHRGPDGLGEVLQILRTAATCREVALGLVRRDGFRSANLALMILLAEQG